MNLTESSLCKSFVESLQYLEKLGQLKPCVWFRVRNEFTGPYNGRFGQRMKSEGVKAGVADYVFLWDQGCGCLEFKTTTGKLSQPQKEFQEYCHKAHIHYVVVRSPQEGFDVLKSWGLIA